MGFDFQTRTRSYLLRTKLGIGFGSIFMCESGTKTDIHVFGKNNG
jgi:hypothetical protein